jgi:predicted dehydrogenase
VTSLEERLADRPRFHDVDQLLARGHDLFEGAVICLPNDETPRAIARLAAAGKHILTEKPVAVSAQVARPALDAVRAAGIAFQTGYMWRYDSLAERLRDMVADGRFGRLISIEMLFVTSSIARRGPGHYLFDRERTGRGFFNWLACHWLDVLPFVTGQTVQAVTARVGVFAETPAAVEDGGSVILELSGGGLATFIGGYWLPRWLTDSHWTLRGTDRWVDWEPSRASTGGALRIHGPQPQFHAMEEDFPLPVDPTPGYGGARATRLIRDWLSAWNQGNPCRNTIVSTLATLELLDAIYRSSDEGCRVTLKA